MADFDHEISALRKRQLALAERVAGRTGHNIETATIILDGVRELGFKIIAHERIYQAFHTIALSFPVTASKRADYIAYTKHRLAIGLARHLLEKNLIDFEELEILEGKPELRAMLFSISPTAPKKGDV